jgi:phage terminase large subunit
MSLSQRDFAFPTSPPVLQSKSSSIDLSTLTRIQSEYAFNSEKYLRDILNFKCIKWQSEACYDYDTRGHCAWSTGSGVGKTALLARLILHFLHTRPFPVIPCTAPTQRQLYNVLWAEIHRAMNQSAILLKLFEWTQERIYLRGHKEDWFAAAITSTAPKPGANTTESLQGYHAEHIMFIIDECSGIPDQVMGAADGALSTPSARVLMASNPTRNTGYFYRATNDDRLKDLWAIKYVDAGMCDAPYIDQSYISRLKQIYGEDSDYFRMRVRGLPPRTEFNALVSPEQVFAAHQRILPKSGVKFISCDPARYGSDDTVIYVRDGNVVLERIAVHGLDTMQVATAVMQLHHIHDAAEIRVDVIGIGAGVCDRIKSELGKQKSRLKAVHVGEDANSKEEFFNKRAEIAWQIRTNIDNLSIPIDTPFLDEELVAIRYGWDSKDKRIKLEPKDETKRSLNPSRSPNDADSLCLLCANLKTPTSIVNAKYFTIGQTNPNDLSTAKLIQSMKDDGKGVRSGLNLAAFLGGKHSVGIGVNRYREFKGDFSENEGFEHLN